MAFWIFCNANTPERLGLARGYLGDKNEKTETREGNLLDGLPSSHSLSLPGILFLSRFFVDLKFRSCSRDVARITFVAPIFGEKLILQT